MMETDETAGGQRRVLAATSLGYGAAFLGITLLSPLLPSIIDSLDLSAVQAGAAMSVAWGLYAVGQYPGGRLSEAGSRKTVLVWSLAIVCGGSLLLAAGSTYGAFLLATAVVGLGAGLYSPVGIAVVFDAFAARRGQALGVLFGSGDAAGVVSGGIAAGVISVALWRTAYLPIAGLLLVAILLVHRWTDGPYGVPTAMELSIADTARRLFGTSRRRWEIVAFLLWMFAFQATISFLPTFLRVDKGATIGLASGGFALLWFVGILVKPVAGQLGDRYGHFRLCGVTMGVAAVGLGGLVLAATPALLVAAVIAFAAGLLATTPNVFAHVTGTMPDASVGGDVGALRTVFFGVGSLGPVYVGIATDLWSYGAAFTGMVACLAVGTGIVLVLGGETGGSVGTG